MIRYVLAFEPPASTPRETVVATVGPTLQRYLTGDLGLGLTGDLGLGADARSQRD